MDRNKKIDGLAEKFQRARFLGVYSHEPGQHLRFFMLTDRLLTARMSRRDKPQKMEPPNSKGFSL
jgi:hypothetical protein